MSRLPPAVIPALLLALSGSLYADAPPGAAPYPAALQQRLQTALKAQGPDYQPRTEHLLANGQPKYTNRLIAEDSPYLLQHAHNPVDWHPWGPEAFALARQQNKPVFLSIGYSTCHWCHVMEKESFENLAIAEFLNRHFIAIKVDRERRPDVDEVYMTAVMLFTGSGGWPMSSFLTPEGQPIYGGTYYPPRQFHQLLEAIRFAWADHEADLRKNGERMAKRVQRRLTTRGQANDLEAITSIRARNITLRDRDEIQGGFGTAPKFPHESELLLLLELAARNNDSEALEAATDALTAMARGGIHDQVGGGFHRYSTTPDWLVPHFEEMLYNQAMLAHAYLAAWQLSGDQDLAQTARQILDYVLRDMRNSGGAFYSATDADSDGSEGKFFLWTPAQIHDALQPRDAALIIDLFGITEHGNFEGSNILHQRQSLQGYATAHHLTPSTLRTRVHRALSVLYKAREQRIHPGRDDKRVTAWNGMLITALAEAGRLLKEPRYLNAANQAADAILRENARQPGNLTAGLWRVNLNGSASVPAKLDDYAHMIVALLAIYDANQDRQRLRQAQQLADQMLQRFSEDPADPGTGGFYMAEANADGDPLLLRPKQVSDGAVPSSNSVALHALAALATRSDQPRYRNAADALLAGVAGQVTKQPAAYPYLLIAADRLRQGETGTLRYAAAGNVRINSATTPATPQQPARLQIWIDIAPGWHINAHHPLQPDLIGTTLSLPADSPAQLGKIDWPQPIERRLGFLDTPLALYQGHLQLQADLQRPEPNTVTNATLRLQACSNKVCLPPETIRLPLR